MTLDPGLGNRVLRFDADTWFRSERRYYGCAKRGCDRINPDFLSYGAYGKSWCLGHPPLRIRLRRLFGSEC